MRAALLPPAAVAVAFAVGAAMTWRRLGSLLIDGGRELEVPRRLLEGDVLYRDVRYYWGPLAPHLNAALFAIFGVHADVLMWAGLSTGALTCAGVYLLARRFLDRWPSAVTAIAFVFLCAFSMRTRFAVFNFVLPFNCDATYGMAAAIWSVYLLLRHISTGRPGPLFASALLAGIGLLTKVEVVVALAAAHGVFLVSVRPRTWARRAVAYAAGGAVAAAGYLWAADVSQGSIWPSLRLLANPASRHYIADTMGLLSFGLSLGEVALSTLGLAVAAGAAILAGRAVRNPGPTGVVAAVVVALSVPGVVFPDIFFRAMPLLMLAACMVLAHARLRRRPSWGGATSEPHLVLWAFGLASVVRIPLRVGPDHYGFFLLPPVLVCLAVASCSYLPEVINGSPRARAVVKACGVALLAGAAVSAVRTSWPQIGAPCVELVAARAHRCVDPAGPELAILHSLAGFPPSTRVSAVPEGAGLIFAAGLRSGLDGMTSYLPMEIPDDAADARLVERWKQNPPEVVLYTGIGRETGYQGFGADYARQAHRWLSTHYRIVAQPAPQFLVLVP